MESVDNKALFYDKLKFCRICLDTEETEDLIKSPCVCRGSMSHVHVSCLENWFNTSSRTSCDICHMEIKTSKVRRSFLETFGRQLGKPLFGWNKVILAILVVLVNYLGRICGCWTHHSKPDTFCHIIMVLLLSYFLCNLLFISYIHWRTDFRIVWTASPKREVNE
ncbi:E3 ubiquitin-protein ligase MARCHF2-like [Homalodisca vitripennis]|uniref:E3 ubiquitin-protein ligase MARCHF2-like n=1 Tax=Homalodisca vitripennis TaxID=197043 RepID=UPI001EEAD274|nr:E3 ubiquitin-protein ligase MARCHF2-like [Homalodisca vitripennis]KAG8246078.1 hypothetical protein J6590_093062 [Homalodisca vitripennis]KAG8270549.1 hypothetical protein J6590_083428 [Homalodisca vitripennis]